MSGARSIIEYELSAEIAYSSDYLGHSGHAVGMTSGIEGPIPFAHFD